MNYFVQLRRDSAFFPLLPEGFGFVPVKQVSAPGTWTTRGTTVPVFVTAALCGNAREPEPCLWLDWSRVNPEQRPKFARAIAELRGGGDPREVIHYLDHGGEMPIRVSQTVGAPFPL